jgi:tetratricopeptide (TPR) repeat protein
LSDAATAYQEALDLLPDDAVNDLAVVHNQLGAIHAEAGDLNTALSYYRKSARYEERRGDYYGAGQIRFNVAFVLRQADRFEDALLYAQTALRDFEQAGLGAATEIERAQELIAKIEQAPSRSRKPRA